MKKLICILFIVLAGFSFGQNGELTMHIEYNGIEEGYDHLTKDEIYLDGELVLTTDEHKSSVPLDFSLVVPRGNHTLRFVNWTFYEGTWEETKVENDYTLDAFGEIKCKIRKKSKLSIIYDLDDTSSPFVKFN